MVEATRSPEWRRPANRPQAWRGRDIDHILAQADFLWAGEKDRVVAADFEERKSVSGPNYVLFAVDGNDRFLEHAHAPPHGKDPAEGSRKPR